MKKKVIQADGTIIEYEGTAEEIAELEREAPGSTQKTENKKKGRRLLNEEKVAAMISEALGRHEMQHWNDTCKAYHICFGCWWCRPVCPAYPMWVSEPKYGGLTGTYADQTGKFTSDQVLLQDGSQTPPDMISGGTVFKTVPDCSVIFDDGN